MAVRRAFLWWQFAAVVVLPIWLFLARGVFGARLGWDLLASVIAAPALGLALLVVAVLVLIRPSVFRARAVSWADVGVLGAWHAAVVWLCFEPAVWLVWVVIGLALVAFWTAVWLFVTDASRRVAGAVRDFGAGFSAAVGRPRTLEPIDLGELRPVDDAAGARGDGRRSSVAE